MKTITTTVYQASNEKVFMSYQECFVYEQDLNIRAFVKELGLGEGGTWSGSMIAQALIDNKGKLFAILYGAAPDETT